MIKKRVLDILKTTVGQWVSGEDICRQLSVSRTAVWKHIRSLKQDGYHIETQPRRGYCLLTVPDLLYPNEIISGLKTKFMGRKVVHYHQLLSTNDEAKELASKGASEGTIVVTEEQIGGKGRLGRKWHSANASDIMFSAILCPNINPAETPQVSMLAAVAVAKAVGKTSGVKPGIKWPNDLLVNGNKLSGILVEISAEADRVKYIVLGIGINVNSTKEDWPEDIQHKTTSLREESGEIQLRTSLIKNVLYELENLYLLWQCQGFAIVLEMWREWCVSQQCTARVETIRGNFTGWIEGVNNDGHLLLRLNDGKVKTFSSGDVSLRL